LPFGAVRTTEQYFGAGADQIDGVRRLRAAVRQRLRRSVPARQWSGARMFGSGGTFTNAARIILAREAGRAPAVHGSTITIGDFHRVLELATTLTVEERRQLPGLNPERADIILAGLAVATEVLEHFGAPGVVVSAFGLREGLLLHLSQQSGNGKEPTRGRALRRFADRCRTDRRHVEQVLRLSRRLYDALGRRLGCQEGDWEILEAAALLHDVGQLVSYKGHHKHSYHLITHAENLPLSPEDRLLVATVSRYHRRSPPTKKHPEYARLPKDQRERVKRLAALLRVADGLDRGHIAAVETLRIRLSPTRLRIEATPRLATTDLKLELWGASRKSDLLAKLLGVEVEIVGSTLGPADG
ncbi:MAG TPA: HD domain-containing protein, partial [Gemmatimonadales bacterium]|nr:HD domain-containing protein [Gemmatimonadales bacterium]